MKKFSLVLILFSLTVVSAYANKTQVMKAAKEVVTAMKNKNMVKLWTLVHPKNGVRFSPYSYIDKDSDLVFSKSEIASAWNNKRLYLWGEFDGSGDPIRMGFSKYFGRFVYDRNFASAPSIKYGLGAIRGNTMNNLAEVYPNGKFVEYHFEKGPPPKYNEIGWASLHLAFEKSGKKWYLVGISHGEWTI